MIEDGQLRDNVANVIESGKGAYDRLGANGAPHKTVLEDSSCTTHVQSAAGSVRDIALALNEVDAKHGRPFPANKRKHRMRKLLLIVATIGLALALSESLRNKLLDLLFGSEEEFQYTPPAPRRRLSPRPARSARHKPSVLGGAPWRGALLGWSGGVCS